MPAWTPPPMPGQVPEPMPAQTPTPAWAPTGQLTNTPTMPRVMTTMAKPTWMLKGQTRTPMPAPAHNANRHDKHANTCGWDKCTNTTQHQLEQQTGPHHQPQHERACHHHQAQRRTCQCHQIQQQTECQWVKWQMCQHHHHQQHNTPS